MKSIAFIVSEMDPGGVSEALIKMLQKFDYEHYDVTVWVAHGKGLEHHRLSPQVHIKKWGTENSYESLISQLKNGQVLLFLRNIVFRFFGRCYIKYNDIHTYYCVRSLPELKTETYDYVIAYQGVSPMVIPNALYRISGKKRILWIHGDLGREKKIMPFCTKLYRKFDQAIAVSEAARDLFIEQYDYPITKTSVVHNIIDVQQIRKLADHGPQENMKPTSILTVGRLSVEKGQTNIPHAVQLLLESGYDIHWYLVGEGNNHDKIASEIEKYGVQEHVHLLGLKENPYPYIKNCDIYVQTSLSEGWCLTVQEARILHKPMVITPLPVMHEQIVDGENGLIAADTTPEALAESIRYLLDHPELQEKFIENLKKEKHDNADELQKLYDFIES